MACERTPCRECHAPHEAEALTSLSAAISRARAGLVQELIEVFNVVEVGGRVVKLAQKVNGRLET